MAAKDPPEKILDALIAALGDVDCRFKVAEIYVPEVLFVARAMAESMPTLAEVGITPKVKAIIGSAQWQIECR